MYREVSVGANRSYALGAFCLGDVNVFSNVVIMQEFDFDILLECVMM